ncbi:unnamed protein product [Peronospora belbahrii]|uniref:Uncharacterized protein n=1 Tax=Peronospora belbahrii TaxID=622444 RepID=A0AAU9L7T7_9STRA|nr:unnamed protein product [Peronospora belbahrii]
MASYRSEIPSLTPRISELYGANGSAFRVGEADSYIQDLDELECEEKALEKTVQELVNRRAAVPIGVKFHREGASSTMMQQETIPGSKVIRGSEVPRNSEVTLITSSLSVEEEEEEMGEEEEDMDEDDEEDEEMTGRATIVRGERHQRSEDSFARDSESADDLFASDSESANDLFASDIEPGNDSMDVEERSD